MAGRLEDWAARSRGRGLLVKRFDRKGGDLRVHMEELAQVINAPTAPEWAKYRVANLETVAVVAGALAGIDAVAEVVDRIVLNVMIGNGDAHVKNWAFTYPDGRRPALSPVYDILPTVLYVPADHLGLNLADTKTFSAITPASFGPLGGRSGYGAEQAVKRAESAVERVMENWRILQPYLTEEKFQALTKRLDQLALVGRAAE